MILICRCGYATPFSPSYARKAFRQHRCDRPVFDACIDCGKRRGRQESPRCRPCGFRYRSRMVLEQQSEVDEMAVERLLSGLPVRATRAERQAAVAYLTRRGMSAEAIAARLRISERTVCRLRSRA